MHKPSDIPTRLVNLTPHTVRIFHADGDGVVEVKPDGRVAHAPSWTSPEVVRLQAGGPEVIVSTQMYGRLEDLPPPVEGTLYIVSRLALDHVPPERVDVVCPDTTPGQAVYRSGRVWATRRLRRVER